MGKTLMMAHFDSAFPSFSVYMHSWAYLYSTETLCLTMCTKTGRETDNLLLIFFFFLLLEFAMSPRYFRQTFQIHLN